MRNAYKMLQNLKGRDYLKKKAPEKLIPGELDKLFAFYGNEKSITVFTKPATESCPGHTYLVYLFVNTIIPSTPRSPRY
jgi:hypothetical protein